MRLLCVIFFNWCLLSVCVVAHAASSEAGILREARQAFTQGQFIESQMLLQHADADRYPYHVLLLQAQIYLAQKKIADFESSNIMQANIEIWPLSLRGLWQQTMAEYYDQLSHFARSKKHYQRALANGVATVQQDRCVFRLAQIAYMNADNALAARYARIVWYHYSTSAYRAEAGLLLASVIVRQQPVRARGIITDIRLLKTLSPQQKLRADEQLLELLIQQDSREAESVAVKSLSLGNAQSQGNIPALRAIAVMQHDPIRGQKLIAALPVDAYALLDPWRQQHLKEGAEKNAVDTDSAFIKRMRELLSTGEKIEVLRAIAAYGLRDQRFLLLALECGANPMDFVRHELATQPVLALRLSELLTGKHTAVGLELLHRALKKMPQPVVKERVPVYVALLLSAYAKTPVSDEGREGIVLKLLRQDVRNRHLGELWCRQAQAAQRASQWQRSEMLWSRAVINLPFEHLWYALAAERWAMTQLLAVPPGTVVHLRSDRQASALRLLIEQLSVAAWHNDDEQAQRCRYLLGQALAQIGNTSEAQICFESLLNHASDQRKSKITKALARLRQYPQAVVGGRSVGE